MLIQAAGQNIYIDPAKAGNYEGLPQADLILVTDIHYDHLDIERIGKLRKAGTKFIAPEAVAKTLTEAAVIRPGEMKEFGGWKIEAVPAYNVKHMQPSGEPWHPKGRGIGYVLTYGGKRFYISGDTEGVPEMRALKNIDAAFVCMNLPYTMAPEEAAEAIRAFQPKVAYPYHCNNSNLSALEKALAGSGVEVRVRNWYY
jgi:L-ascorbate metabolism protein UlaG (beta-lactamase superfamily)